MRSEINAKQYDSRSSYAAGDYYGVGQTGKMGKLRCSYVDGVPMNSKVKDTNPKEIGVKDITPKKVG